MHIKPLTPKYVKQFSKTLRKNGVKSSVLEIFFKSITELIDPYENNVTQNIENIMKDCNFESMDDINAFLMEYNDFTNGSIGFINSFDTIEDNNIFDKEVQPLFEALCSESKDCDQILLQSIDKILAKTIEVYEIDVELLSDDDYIRDILGEDLKLVMTVLISASIAMHEGEVERDDLETLRANFILVNSFVYILDGARKDELDRIDEDKHFVPRGEQKKVTKVGRNEPCPCGSGKKYKKCCMNKQGEKDVNPLDELDLPMASHFPLSEKDINEFYAIWTRLIDFTSKLLSEMSGKKYKKIYRRDSDGRYHFDDEIVDNNYILHIRGFLLDNFDRIVDDFIASNRVSKVNLQILQEWKRYRLNGDKFFIYKGAPFGALVWDIDGDSYYYVYDLYDSLYELSVQDKMLSMLLLPFKGRVIYDGLIATKGISLGQNAKDMFLKDYIVLREKKDVSISLPHVSSTTKIYPSSKSVSKVQNLLFGEEFWSKMI